MKFSLSQTYLLLVCLPILLASHAEQQRQQVILKKLLAGRSKAWKSRAITTSKTATPSTQLKKTSTSAPRVYADSHTPTIDLHIQDDNPIHPSEFVAKDSVAYRPPAKEPSRNKIARTTDDLKVLLKRALSPEKAEISYEDQVQNMLNSVDAEAAEAYTASREVRQRNLHLNLGWSLILAHFHEQ